MEEVRKREEEMLRKQGWFSHIVIPEGEADWLNYHTHGLPQRFGHPDFQLVLPINGNTLHALAATLIVRVGKGERFSDGMRVSGVVRNHDVLLMETRETRIVDRRVLRVILPDKDGNLDKAHMSGIFAAQFRELPD